MAYYQQNRLSIKSCTTLANLLAELLLLNESIQSFREALASTPFFDSIALFRFLDKQQKGYLCEKDILKVIGTSHRKLLTYAFSWVDNLKEGEISRLEFATFLLPRQNLQLRETVAERVEHPELSVSQGQTILQQFDIFRQMIMEIMTREMKLIELRRALIESKDYSLRGVILSIDNSRHDWVCGEDIFKFMKNYGFDADLRQIQRLVEVVNFRVDGKVTEEQLKWTVEGLQGKDKNYLNKIKNSNKKKPPKKPVNFQQNFITHLKQKIRNEQSTLQKNPIEGVYRGLLQKKKLIEVEQNLVDHSLLVKQDIALENNRAQCQRQRISLQIKREMEAQKKAREREEWLVRKEMEKEFENIISKTSALEAESQRLERLENKLARQDDTNYIRKSYFETAGNYSSALYGDQKENLKRYKPQPQSFGIESTSYPLKYQPTSFGFESTSFPLRYQPTNFIDPLRESRSQAIRAHLQSSQTYLQVTRELRDKIKRERQIQKHIHDQFLSNPGSKYGSYFIHQSTGKTQQKIHQEKIPGQIKDISKSGVKELGLISNQKRSEGRLFQMQQSNQLKPIDIDGIFQTPDQRDMAGNSSMAKMEGTTTNKGQ